MIDANGLISWMRTGIPAEELVDMEGFLMQRTVACLVLAMCVIGMGSPTAAASDIEGKWGVEAEMGVWKLVEGYWDHSNVDVFGGFGVRRGLSRNWAATLIYRYGTVRPGTGDPRVDAGWSVEAFEINGTRLHTEIHNPTLSFEYLIRPESRFRPFVGLGLGLTAWRVLAAENLGFFPSGTTVQGFESDGDSYEKLQSVELTLATEVGADWWVSENLSLRLGARYHIMPGNSLDNIGLSSENTGRGRSQYVDANKGLVQGFVGATLWFGGVNDSDGDGVEDRYDRCPRAREDLDGFEDQDGCPDYDNDGDGIGDDNDACPLEPEDHDGFQDEDGCPDPDNDGDGVIDSLDRAPDQAEDMDGFEDEDGAPDLDNDGDGVPDDRDSCPETTPGAAVDSSGCAVKVERPAESAAVQAMEEGLILEGVTFRSGSAQIKPASLDVLQRIASSLRDNQSVRVEVRGHTDSQGAAETNRQLSHRRAMAVRDFLIQLGISPSRITAVGYGETYPIATNDTAQGRAKNRRVEVIRID